MIKSNAQPRTTSKLGQRNSSESFAFSNMMKDWLSRITRSEKPAKKVIAYNIGLFQTEQGYGAYLCGATKYLPNDDDWATEEAFTPKERYFSFPTEFAKGVNWKQAERATISAVRRFLTENPDSFLAKANALTVGFDDGDLVRVK